MWLASFVLRSRENLPKNNNSFTVLKQGHVLLVSFVSTSETEKREIQEGGRSVTGWNVLSSGCYFDVRNISAGAAAAAKKCRSLRRVLVPIKSHNHGSTRSQESWLKPHFFQKTNPKKETTHPPLFMLPSLLAGFLCNDGLEMFPGGSSITRNVVRKRCGTAPRDV